MSFDFNNSAQMEKQAGPILGGIIRYGLGGKHWANLLGKTSAGNWLRKQMKPSQAWERKFMKNLTGSSKNSEYIGGLAPIVGGLGLHGIGAATMAGTDDNSTAHQVGKTIKNISTAALGPWGAPIWLARAATKAGETGARQTVDEAANKASDIWFIGDWLANKIRERGNAEIDKKMRQMPTYYI